MARNIDDLRNHLFETLEALKDKKNPMDIERAKAIAGVAQVIINSAKVEVQNACVNGGMTSGFLTPKATGIENGKLQNGRNVPLLDHTMATMGRAE